MAETNKGSATGCMGLVILLIVGVIIFSGGSGESEKPKKEVNWQPTINAIEQAKKAGYLTRIENDRRTVYVNSFLWQSADAQIKENSVTTFAQYLGYLNDMDQAVGVTVKDDQSGKTLAEYSIFSGVSIE